MQDPSGEKASSPPKTSRVEDGKIRKIRTNSKPEFTPIQQFNGKTYACESCKRGHRVNKCDHGRTRPISETNLPGRPSGGQKREAFLIVRVDGPQIISREATSSPKPIWEDPDENKWTLKKIWADANGKEIDDQEYQERQRRLKEREVDVVSTPDIPKSSCCGSKKPKEETQSPLPESVGGCRHRQNLEKQPEPDTLAPAAADMGTAAKESWKAACSCGSGCSCLYCPDHPNNATSINHAQQQVKNLAEQALPEFDELMPVSFMPEANSTSCMGGRPTFFLSRTPNVSQQTMQQFFPDLADPNAIYLRYPISQHSWTNQPASSHCSQLPTPTAVMSTMTQDANEQYVDPMNDMSGQPVDFDFLPSDPNGTWDFSGNQFGDASFSWTDLDASRGTDYNIGQATVASAMDGSIFPMPQSLMGPQIPAINVSMDNPMMSPTHLSGLSILDGTTFAGSSTPQFHPQNTFTTFDNPMTQGNFIHDPRFHQGVPQQGHFSGQGMNAIYHDTPAHPFGVPQPHTRIVRSHSYNNMPNWDQPNTLTTNDPMSSDFRTPSMATSPPIANHV
ncbi:hypothetical protein LTR67_010661 [Exophiala xenobiotica]